MIGGPSWRELRPAGWAVALLLLAATGAGCRREPPNILLVSIDTMRRDHVSAYGYRRPTTPAIDRLAAEGALFENAWSTSSWTLPAHMSTFTGALPSTHQVEEETDRLPPGILTLAEHLRSNGFATAGFASHVFLGVPYGFARGFDVYDVHVDQRADAVTRRAARWLARRPHRPFFLFVHYFDPHWSYDPPAEIARRFDPGYAGPAYGELEYLLGFSDPHTPLPPEIETRIFGLYDGEIRFADDQLGVLLDALRRDGVLDHTIVAVVSDHGEEFKDHGSFGHGGSLYAEVARVPMALRYPPRVRRGTRVRPPVSLADIPATLTGLAGVPVPEAFRREGSDLAPLLTGGDDGARHTLVLESTRVGPKRFALVTPGLRYQSRGTYRYDHVKRTLAGIVSPLHVEVTLPEALYDTDRDPREEHNLLALPHLQPRTTRAVAALRRGLREHLRTRVAGLYLICRPGAGAGEAIVVEMASRVATLDEPFAVGLGEGDVIEPLPDHTGVRASLHLAGGETWIGLPLRGQRGSVELRLDGPGARLQSLEIPVPGRHLLLGTVGASRCRLLQGLATPAAERSQLTLPDEQVEQLRGLGYVR